MMTAQSTLPQCNGPLTVSSQADADTISLCDNFIGNVIIDSSVSGSLELNGVRTISGDLTAANATALTSLSADTLDTIYGDFDLDGLIILSTLLFPSLTTARVLRFNGLPSLQALDFAAGVSQADLVSIANTQLNDLSGLDLTYARDIDITNNAYLTTVGFSDLTNLTGSLSVSSNGRDLSLSLPTLDSAANITLRNVSGIYLGGLKNITGALGIYSSDTERLSLNSLSSTGNAVAVVDCPNLNDLNMGALSIVGGSLLLENNTNLPEIRFPRLRSIVGDIAFSGSFSKVELPALTTVQGEADVQTTSSNDTVCNYFEGADSGIINGRVTCTFDNSSATNGSSEPKPSASGSGGEGDKPNKSGPSAGLIAGVVIGAIVAIAIAALAFWYLCIKRKRQSRPPTDISHPKDPELPLGGHHEKSELSADPNHVSELQGDRQHLRDTTQAKEVAGISVIPSNSTDPSSTDSSREARNRDAHGTATITDPSELAWDQYEPRHELHGSDVPELRGERTL